MKTNPEETPMLSESQLVFGQVPASQLDPFLLAEGRNSDEEGYVVILYPERSCDLLFLKGEEIRLAAHLTDDYRFAVQQAAVQARFRQYRSDSRSLLWFFLAPAESIRRFSSTLFYTPFLNVQLESLGRRQRHELLMNIKRKQCLVELADFNGFIPTIELQAVETNEELQSLAPRLTEGRLMLYDLERNVEMLRMKSQCAVVRPGGESGEVAGSGPVHSSPEVVVPPQDPNHVPSPTGHAVRTPIELAGPVKHPEKGCLRHFEVLFRRFRKQAAQLLGMRYHSLEAKAEKHVRASHPEFHLERLSEKSAPLVLQVMEFVTRKAPVFKRSHLKCMTITLVAEFYSAHYDTLERNKCLDGMEDFYTRLKQ